MNRNSLRPLQIPILIAILVDIFCLVGKSFLAAHGFDAYVLLAGNTLIIGIVIVSFLVSRKSLGASNIHAFVRAVQTSFIIKFVFLAAAAFIYFKLANKQINKPALFACMGLYLLYTFLEVSVLLRLLKQKSNA